MIIAYTRTYSNKQQSDNQKNAIEQFAANNNMTIDKWHKDTRTTSSRHKNRLEDVVRVSLCHLSIVIKIHEQHPHDIRTGLKIL